MCLYSVLETPNEFAHFTDLGLLITECLLVLYLMHLFLMLLYRSCSCPLPLCCNVIFYTVLIG